MTLLPPAPAGVRAWVDPPFIGERVPVGSDLDAVVMGFNGQGELKLSTLESVVAKARGPWGARIRLQIDLIPTARGGLLRPLPSGTGLLTLHFPPAAGHHFGRWVGGRFETDGNPLKPGASGTPVVLRSWHDPSPWAIPGAAFELRHVCLPGERTHELVIGGGRVIGEA